MVLVLLGSVTICSPLTQTGPCPNSVFTLVVVVSEQSKQSTRVVTETPAVVIVHPKGLNSVIVELQVVES